MNIDPNTHTEQIFFFRIISQNRMNIFANPETPTGY